MWDLLSGESSDPFLSIRHGLDPDLPGLDVQRRCLQCGTALGFQSRSRGLSRGIELGIDQEFVPVKRNRGRALVRPLQANEPKSTTTRCVACDCAREASMIPSAV